MTTHKLAIAKPAIISFLEDQSNDCLEEGTIQLRLMCELLNTTFNRCPRSPQRGSIHCGPSGQKTRLLLSGRQNLQGWEQRKEGSWQHMMRLEMQLLRRKSRENPQQYECVGHHTCFANHSILQVMYIFQGRGPSESSLTNQVYNIVKDCITL